MQVNGLDMRLNFNNLLDKIYFITIIVAINFRGNDYEKVL